MQETLNENRIINVPSDYSTIQQALNSSIVGDTILVQPGIYNENIDFYEHNIILGSLFILTGDSSYMYTTIIDGDYSGSVLLFNGSQDSTTIITGFTIRNGQNDNGGAISCLESNPTIRDNYIINNSASEKGGGIYCENSYPKIENNIFSGNISANNGGGIYSISGGAIVKHNIFDNNLAANVGGGIYCEDGYPVLTNNTLIENHAEIGAGITCSNSNSVISYNDVIGNVSSNYGGGIYCEEAAPIIKYNIIIENTAANNGGGFFCFDSSPLIENNIIGWNLSGNRGGGFYGVGDNPVIVNTIFWADSANSGNEIYIFSGAPLISYCDIQDTIWNGIGNISADPLFRDPDNGDYHLKSVECGDPYDSPCIDAGQPDIEDILLNCDWGLGTILSDMGAYGGGDSVRVDINDYVVDLPHQFTFLQNYPNPFNPSTTIRYALPEQSDVRIEIYNILGQRVAEIFSGNLSAGYHTVTWQADDYPSGVYFARLEAGTRSESVKMVLLK